MSSNTVETLKAVEADVHNTLSAVRAGREGWPQYDSEWAFLTKQVKELHLLLELRAGLIEIQKGS